jgi:predicted NACHT family NTPase
MFVIFDGIDEIISAAQRREVIAATKQMANVFSQNRFVFTCRKTDFQITPISDVEIYLLQPFNLGDIHEYFRSASRWVFDKSPSQIDEQEPAFIQQASRHASEFIRSPLLLALIVWIYSVGQRIPDNRIELYAECSDLLFRRWDSLKKLDPDLPDPHWLFQLVKEIAQRLYFFRSDEGPPNLDWLKERVLEFFQRVYEIDAENRARAAADRFAEHLIGRSWILQESTAGSFEFSHRTFMEYYYARWLDDTFDGIELLFEYARPYILAGEQSVPLHLAFQIKASGKLKSAEVLISVFINLIKESTNSIVTNVPRPQTYVNPLSNAISFFIESTDYLQPSEV